MLILGTIFIFFQMLLSSISAYLRSCMRFKSVRTSIGSNLYIPNNMVPRATPMLLFCYGCKTCYAGYITSYNMHNTVSTVFEGFSCPKVQIISPQVLCIHSRMSFSCLSILFELFCL